MSGDNQLILYKRVQADLIVQDIYSTATIVSAFICSL